MDGETKQKKIEEYELFIEERLKKDLAEIEAVLRKKYENYMQWENLKALTRGLKMQQNENREQEIMVNMGCNVFAHGRVEESNTMLVNIGCDCYLVMDYDEAFKYANIRIRLLTKEMDHYRKLAVEVKMRIKLFLLAIEELNSKK